jgi:hypothetical protein
MESVGFKEWAVVCEALGCGRQSIIVRKGGIAEGRAGFSFRHKEFFLFPTWFHEQPDKVRQTEIAFPEPDPEVINIRFFAKLESAHVISSWKIAEALEPLHILQPGVVRERFEYDEAPGLHVAFVRMARLRPAWTIANEKEYGGCRSWVNLPELPADVHLDPILSDDEHVARRNEFVEAIGRDHSPQSSP